LSIHPKQYSTFQHRRRFTGHISPAGVPRRRMVEKYGADRHLL
jgi:hypothetical protein